MHNVVPKNNHDMQKGRGGVESIFNKAIWGIVLGHKPPSQPVTTSLAARHQLKCSGSILSMQYFSTKSSGAPDAWLNAQRAESESF